jgi:hypothetical protein
MSERAYGVGRGKAATPPSQIRVAVTGRHQGPVRVGSVATGSRTRVCRTH